MKDHDADAAERARRVCALMNERLRSRTPQERDRLMQVHLAEARGPAMNGYLLSRTMNWKLRLEHGRSGSADA